jgi:uncharacterized tellurite resistance protein B-like protein
MFRTLQDLFGALRPAPGAAAPDLGAVRLACAVLLVEVMKAQPEVTEAERKAVAHALHRRFSLGEDELHRLIGLAEQASRQAGSFHEFTAELNAALDQPEKIAIVETMWQVAYADGSIDAHENHVISRIAGLLHVTHGEYIAAKLHAKQAAGL